MGFFEDRNRLVLPAEYTGFVMLVPTSFKSFIKAQFQLPQAVGCRCALFALQMGGDLRAKGPSLLPDSLTSPDERCRLPQQLRSILSKLSPVFSQLFAHLRLLLKGTLYFVVN